MTSSAGTSGLILRRVAAQRLHRVAHGREVDDRGTPVKSCSSTRAGMKAISRRRLGLRVPGASARMSAALTDLPVLVAQQVLEQDAQREGQPPRLQAGRFQGRETVNLELPFTDVQGAAAAETVHGAHC